MALPAPDGFFDAQPVVGEAEHPADAGEAGDVATLSKMVLANLKIQVLVFDSEKSKVMRWLSVNDIEKLSKE